MGQLLSPSLERASTNALNMQLPPVVFDEHEFICVPGPSRRLPVGLSREARTDVLALA